MRNALAGIVALVVAACLAPGCGGSVSTSNGSPRGDAGNQDGTLASGGSNKADAASESGGDAVVAADVPADALPGPDAVKDAAAVICFTQSCAVGCGFPATCASGQTTCSANNVWTCLPNGTWGSTALCKASV